MLGDLFNDAVYSAAKEAIVSGGDVKPVTHIISHILQQKHAAAAYDLVSTPSPKPDGWLPEALTLFNTAGLSAAQKKAMNHSIFNTWAIYNDAMSSELADVNARLGRYGFSFPQWRYLTQGFDGPSLIERYGMTRLKRDTDHVDPALPDPARDLFGPGFIWSNDTWYVEYRRAYILCANRSGADTAAIIIRNNSYFFGRDRLASAVYASWELHDDATLQALTPEQIGSGKSFHPWREAMNVEAGCTISDHAARIANVLDYLDHFDMKISLWLQEDGIGDLSAFLNHRLAAQAASGKPGMPYMARIDPQSPPWFPQTVHATTLQTTPGTLARLFDASAHDGLKLVLLTGANGDLPLKPVMP